MKTITDAQLARAAALRAEGMPAPWISEDLGLHPSQVRRIAPADPAGQHEWLVAWAAIRRDPELRRLHYEFTPPAAHHRH